MYIPLISKKELEYGNVDSSVNVFDINSSLTVVEWKDCHFLAVATVSDLQNSYCNQWPHPY